jgi:hypothetical protein
MTGTALRTLLLTSIVGLATFAGHCSAPREIGAANLSPLGPDDDLLDSFKDLHSRIYDVYSLGPDRDAVHDLLSASFAGRALTREYVEHYTTLVRMREERTAIQVIRVDYEKLEVLDRDPQTVSIDADWSVGGVVTHRKHQHPRVNRYRAVYTLARPDNELRIVGTWIRNSERIESVLALGDAWALDELPSSPGGLMDPLELLRAGVGGTAPSETLSTPEEDASEEDAP